METNDQPTKPEDFGVASDATRSEADNELFQKVIGALHGNCLIDSKKIKVRVTDRHVLLEGSVQFENERNLAAECITDIFGISEVSNEITFPFESNTRCALPMTFDNADDKKRSS